MNFRTLAVVVGFALSPARLAFAHEPEPHDHEDPAPDNSDPVVRTFVEATYPADAKEAGIGGDVVLRLQIDRDGRVTDASVYTSVHPTLDEAALVAARKLLFHPAHVDGRPVPKSVLFEYRFVPPGHAHAEPVTLPAKPPVLLKGVDTFNISASVEEERPLTAASARTVRDRDLRLRPILRPAELLRVTPGLMVVQHAGGGKANQYLLRGFDADHGTDIALNFDGVPINMVSHGHGQGYADTNWIIPELVERVEVSKGPYFVENGDFSTAGSVDLVSRDHSESFLSLGGGSFDTARAVAIAAPQLGAWHPLVAAEVIRTDGPFENPEKFNKLNLHSKLVYEVDARSRIAFAATSYTGSWRASGQIPSRAVRAGLVGFFGSLDPSEGGISSRQNLSLSYRFRPDKLREFSAMAYLSSYDFNLRSNFTFFSRDPVNGDGIEQWDARSIAGARAHYRWIEQWMGLVFDSTIGGSARADDINNGLAYTATGERLAKVADAAINEASVGFYGKEEVQVTRWLRVVGGLRVDHFTFRVDDNLEDLAEQGTATSGSRGKALMSPKGSLIVSPHRTTDLFVNFGYGFHSNDARGVVRRQQAVTPLTQTLGYEVGARTRLLDRRLELAVALWGIDIDSEIVWVGDEGVTEEAAATRRLGVEFEGRAELLPWLFADVDVTVTDAKYRQNAGNGRAIALAPRLTVSGGISAMMGNGFRGGVRGLHIAERPATEDEFLKAEAITLVDTFAAYRWRAFEVSLTIENVLDSRYKSAQFATTTRLAGEAPTDAPPPPNACAAGTRAQTGDAGNFVGCEDVSFSPGYPINVRLMGTMFF